MVASADDDNPSVGYVIHGDTRAELFSDRSWEVTVAGIDQPLMADLLRLRYDGQFGGPAYGYPGQAVLQDLAERTGGAAHPVPRKPGPPGTVY